MASMPLIALGPIVELNFDDFFLAMDSIIIKGWRWSNVTVNKWIMLCILMEFLFTSRNERRWDEFERILDDWLTGNWNWAGEYSSGTLKLKRIIPENLAFGGLASAF